MDRLEQLLQYYTKCRRGAILHQWKELCEMDESNMVEVINRFYELLLSDLQEQTKWYITVFHQPPSSSSRVLLPIYSQALSALEPNPLHGLESLIKKPDAAEGLFILQQIKLSADRLAQGFEANLKEIGPMEDEVLFHFAESLYQLFRLLVSNKYKTLCQNHLTEHFSLAEIDSDDISDTIHHLKQNHSKINSLMESTLNNCLTLTQGCGIHLLIEVLCQQILLCSLIAKYFFILYLRLGISFCPNI
jgi:hypothetical protein